MTTAPQNVTVQVSNATAKSGLAATASSQLKRQGFKVKTPDDYPELADVHHGALLARQ